MNTLFPDPLKCLSTDKITLFPIDEKLQAGFKGIVVRCDVYAPCQITLFQAQAVDLSIPNVANLDLFSSFLL